MLPFTKLWSFVVDWHFRSCVFVSVDCTLKSVPQWVTKKAVTSLIWDNCVHMSELWGVRIVGWRLFILQVYNRSLATKMHYDTLYSTYIVVQVHAHIVTVHSVLHYIILPIRFFDGSHAAVIHRIITPISLCLCPSFWAFLSSQFLRGLSQVLHYHFIHLHFYVRSSIRYGILWRQCPCVDATVESIIKWISEDIRQTISDSICMTE